MRYAYPPYKYGIAKSVAIIPDCGVKFQHKKLSGAGPFGRISLFARGYRDAWNFP
jgi:hypothetical protein